MSARVFYDPDTVEQLAACGIRARRRPGDRAGFTLTINGQRMLPGGPTPTAAPTATTPSDPQTALELAEECDRLRRDNRRLSDEVARLRSEVDRLTAGPSAPRPREAADLDDSARRFSLIELDL